MSLMMPDGKSWTQPYQNPYATPPSPAQQQQQTQNTQKNDQQQGNWAYNQAPAPAKSSPAPDMSAYAPGKAQPMQQSYGTQYGDITPEAAARGLDDNGGMPFMRPSTPQPSQPQNPYANMAPGVYYGGQQIQGSQQQALDTAMRMRDAMAVQVSNNNLKYQMANAFGKDLGQPTFDYDSAMKQAQDMVANGFYNPFSDYYKNNPDPFDQIGQYAPPSLYNPQQPIGGFTPPFAGMPTQPNFGGQPVSKQSIYQPLTPPPAPEQPEYSHKQVPGSEWDQVQQAWKLPAKPAPQRPDYGPSWPAMMYSDAPMEVTLATPRVSPTTPTSGNWIQRPDGQWEETQPKMYGGPDPVLRAPEQSNREKYGGYPIDARYLASGSEPGLLQAPEQRPSPGLIDPRYAPGGAQPIQPPSQGMPYDRYKRSNKPSAEQAAITQKARKEEKARIAREREARDLARQKNEWATMSQSGNSAVQAWNQLQGRSGNLFGRQ